MLPNDKFHGIHALIFQFKKENFHDVRLRVDGDLIFVSTDNGSWPQVLNHSTVLSENEGTESVTWITTRPSFCEKKERLREYQIEVRQATLDSTTKDVPVNFAGEEQSMM